VHSVQLSCSFPMITTSKLRGAYCTSVCIIMEFLWYIVDCSNAAGYEMWCDVLLAGF